MKVFTVGLDQKPPIKDVDTEKNEKTGSPPPGYTSTTTSHIPLPIGPEILQPLPPIMMRKSRGYKGIVLIMLAVFLMAIFALTLSEIAYNRQRDLNYFRLAELKHRIGSGISDYYYQGNPPVSNYKQQKELNEMNNLNSQSHITPELSTTSSTQAPVLAEVIDTSESRPLQNSMSFSRSNSHSSSGELPSVQDSAETLRDRRFQLLKLLLQHIKQHAEENNFDGTMQVSVIRVQPQIEDASNNRKSNFFNRGEAIGPIFPSLFSHNQPKGRAEDLAPKSDSFMDAFGETHQPSFAQNNLFAERGQARTNYFRNNENGDEEPPIDVGSEFGQSQWPRSNNPFPSEGLIRSLTWQPQLPFPMSPAFNVLPRSVEHWPTHQINSNSVIDNGNEEFPINSARQQISNVHPMFSVLPQFPLQQQTQPRELNMNQQRNQGQEQMFNNNLFYQQQNQGDVLQNQQFPSQPQNPSLEAGEILGRNIGKKIQEFMGQNPTQPLTYIPPEDRIQVEPPTTSSPLSQQQLAAKVIDNNVGWTHQPEQELPQNLQLQNADKLESYRNFQKMMAAVPDVDDRIHANPESNVAVEPAKSIERPLPAVHTISSSSGSSDVDGNDDTLRDRWAPLKIKPQPASNVPVFAPIDIPVDFPAVKFPLNNNNNNNDEESNDDRADQQRKIISNDDVLPSILPEPTNDELNRSQTNTNNVPQPNIQQSPPMVHHSNPVFFQVDDPTSMEPSRSINGQPLI